MLPWHSTAFHGLYMSRLALTSLSTYLFCYLAPPVDNAVFCTIGWAEGVVYNAPRVAFGLLSVNDSG